MQKNRKAKPKQVFKNSSDNMRMIKIKHKRKWVQTDGGPGRACNCKRWIVTRGEKEYLSRLEEEKLEDMRRNEWGALNDEKEKVQVWRFFLGVLVFMQLSSKRGRNSKWLSFAAIGAKTRVYVGATNNNMSLQKMLRTSCPTYLWETVTSALRVLKRLFA